MHKLTGVEAQRVIAVLEDAADRLTMLVYLPTGDDHALVEKLAENSAGAASAALQTCWQLEEGHSAMLNRVGTTTAGGGAKAAAALHEQSSAAAELQLQMHAATRAVCRAMRKNPVAADLVYSESAASGRDKEAASFAALVSHLQDLTAVMYRKLATTVEEEVANKGLLHDLSERERSAEEERDRLQQSLEMQRTEREREVSSLEQSLAKLRAELSDITHSNSMEMASINSRMKESLDGAELSHSKRKEKLEAKVSKLRQASTSAAVEHREVEAGLRKQKERAETALKTHVSKYDADMAEKQGLIREISAQLDEEQSNLTQLEEYFDKIDADNAQKADEERKLARFQALIEAAVRALGRAAVRIQAVVRGMQQRVEFQKLLAKKRKKGGKGKGKKGKK